MIRQLLRCLDARPIDVTGINTDSTAPREEDSILSRARSLFLAIHSGQRAVIGFIFLNSTFDWEFWSLLSIQHMQPGCPSLPREAHHGAASCTASVASTHSSGRAKQLSSSQEQCHAYDVDPCLLTRARTVCFASPQVSTLTAFPLPSCVALTSPVRLLTAPQRSQAPGDQPSRALSSHICAWAGFVRSSS